MISLLCVASVVLNQAPVQEEPPRWSAGVAISFSSYGVTIANSTAFPSYTASAFAPRFGLSLERKLTPSWSLLTNVVSFWSRGIPDDRTSDRSEVGAGIGLGARRFFGSEQSSTRPSLDARVEVGYARGAATYHYPVGAETSVNGKWVKPFAGGALTSRSEAKAFGVSMGLAGAVDHWFTPNLSLRAGLGFLSLRRDSYTYWSEMTGAETPADLEPTESTGVTYDARLDFTPFLEVRLHF